VGVSRELLLVGKELLVGNGWEGGGLVDNGCLVDLLVDGVGVVYNDWGDGLTLDNRLNSLVDVVVLVLVDVCSDVGGRSLNLANVLCVDVSSSLLVELGLVFWDHVLLVFTDDNGCDRGLVLGGEDLLVLDGLDSVLVVVDVLLTVNGLGSLNVLLRTNVLLGDLWGSLGADLGRVGLGGALEEVLYAIGETVRLGGG